MEEQEPSGQALIAAYTEAHKRNPQTRLDLLRAANLAGLDLSGLDLSAADLSQANLSQCRLEGTNLSGTVTEDTLFVGITIRDLLATGLPPTAILNTRYQADQYLYEQMCQANPGKSEWNSMLYACGKGESGAASLSGAECQQVCDALFTMRWEELNFWTVFSALYPGLAWHSWIYEAVLQQKRETITWAFHHQSVLDSIFEWFERSGNHLWPLEYFFFLEEKGNSLDLAADPWQILREMVWEEALEEENPPKQYPASPWGNAPQITQLRNSAEAWMDHRLVGSTATLYLREYTSYLTRGILFLYHVGPPAPDGSTALISSSGRVWYHDNRETGEPDPASAEQRLLNEWLATFGIGGKAYRWSNHLPRKLFSKAEIVHYLREASVARVIWDIEWYADDSQCTVLACSSQQEEQVSLPQPLDDVDFWGITPEIPPYTFHYGTFELLVSSGSIQPLRKFPKYGNDYWNWTE